MGERHHRYIQYDGNRLFLTEWRRAGVDFATCAQRRPEEDMLPEEVLQGPQHT